MERLLLKYLPCFQQVKHTAIFQIIASTLSNNYLLQKAVYETFDRKTIKLTENNSYAQETYQTNKKIFP